MLIPMPRAVKQPRQISLLAHIGIYYRLTKPRVVLLIVATSIVGMFLSVPGAIPANLFIPATLGIALAAASAAAFNQLIERRSDALMARTRARPLPVGELSWWHAMVFACVLGMASMLVLFYWVNPLTALLTAVSLVGYSVIYTVYLKPRTPHNIVIGGAAGAAPPVLGWTAITGSISLDSVLLFLIIFFWTPPHFWALALYRCDEYARAGIPMLPVTHGNKYTRTSILAYTVILSIVSLMPVLSGLSGYLYLIGAIALNARFVWMAIALNRRYTDDLSHRCFQYSIWYLTALFGLLWIDHYRQQFASSFL